MRSIEETINALKNGEYDDKLTYLYSCDKNDVKKYSDRYIDVINGFEETFGKDGDIALFSAPGRTEIGGNHTDHQHGCVLAGSVNLDVISAARPNGTNTVRIQSRNYPLDVIELDSLEIREKEFDKAISLIRGVIKKLLIWVMTLKALTRTQHQMYLKARDFHRQRLLKCLSEQL